MIYSVNYEMMPADIDVIVEKSIMIDIDPNGDTLTQINRTVNGLETKAKVVLFFLDEDDDLSSIADWCC